jgi:L-fuconolactonase
MRVDSHHHVWDLAKRDQPWTAGLPALRRDFSVDELRPQLQAAGIDATVVVQTVTVAEETPELLALADSVDFVAGVVGWVDLTAPDVGDRLAQLREGPHGRWLVGIRHQVQLERDPEWLLRADVRRGLLALADAGLAYDLLVTADQLGAAARCVRELPFVRFVLDHCGKPPISSGDTSAWRRDIATLASSANCAVKLSGLLTEAAQDWTPEDVDAHANHVLDAFGAERTMWGSDWPVCTLRAPYERVARMADDLLAKAAPQERAWVLGLTAANWYRLPHLPSSSHRDPPS